MIFWPFLFVFCCAVWWCGAVTGQYMATPDAPRDGDREAAYLLSSIAAIGATMALAIWVV